MRVQSSKVIKDVLDAAARHRETYLRIDARQNALADVKQPVFLTSLFVLNILH